jgi:Ser-tRNA(Ala) deacylase AlaX
MWFMVVRAKCPFVESYFEKHTTAHVTQVGKDDVAPFFETEESLFPWKKGGLPIAVKLNNKSISVLRGRYVQEDEGKADGENAVIPIRHYIADDVVVAVGDQVDMDIQQASKANQMRLHTLAHFIAGVIENGAFGLKISGWEYLANQGRVTFIKTREGVPVAKGDVRAVLMSLPKLIKQGASIASFQQGGERHVQIGGYPSCACDGPHAEDVDQIGAMSTFSIIQKGNGISVSFRVT